MYSWLLSSRFSTVLLKSILQSRSTVSIHNQWLIAINSALKRDRILTDKVKFALKKQLVLNTWSGLLKDDSLSDDWTKIEGVLVGIWPMNGKG
jgi:hypothetical protein